VLHSQLHQAVQFVCCDVDSRLCRLRAAACCARQLLLLLLRPPGAVVACCCERCGVVEAVVQLLQVLLVLVWVAVGINLEVDEAL
jgi:hypothetical protein